MFNAKSRHLVLGSGAVQLTVLKTILPKHLAISAESLNFLLGELPIIKGRIDLEIPNAKRANIEEEVANLKLYLTAHRCDINNRLSELILFMYSFTKV